MTARLNLALVAATILIQLFMSAGGARAGSAYDSKVRPPAFTEFGNPETVQILGYNDNDGNSNDAMEPFISRGGNLIFFNTRARSEARSTAAVRSMRSRRWTRMAPFTLSPPEVMEAPAIQGICQRFI